MKAIIKGTEVLSPPAFYDPDNLSRILYAQGIAVSLPADEPNGPLVFGDISVVNPINTSPPSYDNTTESLTTGWVSDGTTITQTWALEPVTPATADELAAKAAQQARAKQVGIISQLNTLDSKSIRPTRSVLWALHNAVEADPADVKTLADLKAQSDALRAQLAV